MSFKKVYLKISSRIMFSFIICILEMQNCGRNYPFELKIEAIFSAMALQAAKLTSICYYSSIIVKQQLVLSLIIFLEVLSIV